MSRAVDLLTGPSRDMLPWLVPASVALHVVIVTLIPNADRTRRAQPAIVVEMQAPLPSPEAEAEPEPEPEPDPKPDPKPVLPTRAELPSRPHANVEGASPEETDPTTSTASSPMDDAPVDFTSMSFAGGGAGIAVTRGAAPPSARSSNMTASPQPALTARLPSAPFVPVAALARPPRAPGLDAELERNYPLDARRAGISGSASLRVKLLADGRVGQVTLTSESYAGFGAACERTVRSARWEAPRDRDGHPVETEIKYVCRFEVRS